MFNSPDPTLLIANQFRNDPRIRQAKRMLLDVLEEHQKKITGVRPPYSQLEDHYRSLLELFTNHRGGKLYFPYIGSGFGKGALVELLDGSVKYDMIGGIGPHYWGHNHPDLLDVNINAALSDTVMQGHLQQNMEAIEVSDLLIRASGLDHCFLTSSGAMANENALKIAFQKKHPAQRLLAFEKCFMGRTLALSQLTDKPAFREGLPLNLAVDYIPFYDADAPEASAELAIKTLQAHLTRYPNQHAAMCFELIQGEGGFNVGTQDFFIRLMEELKKRDVLIIVDEIQTFGRSPALFAYRYFELQDYVDIVTTGKLSQVCATLFRKELKPKPGLLSQTFTTSAMALHASKWIINSLMSGGYFGPSGKISRIHQRFLLHFKRLEELRLIRGPYGIGAMIAFTPGNGELAFTTRFIQRLFEKGVISFIAGTQPSRVRFLVPIEAIEEKDVDEVMKIVENLLKEKEANT